VFTSEEGNNALGLFFIYVYFYLCYHLFYFIFIYVHASFIKFLTFKNKSSVHLLRLTSSSILFLNRVNNFKRNADPDETLQIRVSTDDWFVYFLWLICLSIVSALSTCITVRLVDTNNFFDVLHDVASFSKVRQTGHSYPFGTAVNAYKYNDHNQPQCYRDFIHQHFNWAVLENAQKWPAVEPQQVGEIIGTVTVKTCGTIANSLLGFVVPSTY
jgi:hypothetical protein